jgi:hypothetical protein
LRRLSGIVFADGLGTVDKLSGDDMMLHSPAVFLGIRLVAFLLGD